MSISNSIKKMNEFWLQIKDLLFHQKDFKFLISNYNRETINIISCISKIEKTNVLEQKISGSKEKI